MIAQSVCGPVSAAFGRRPPRAWWPALAALVLLGCASAPPIQPERSYRLSPVPLEGPSGQPAQVILLVNNLAARGFLGGRQIVFRTREEPLRAQRYESLLWEEPPSRGLAAALADALRAAQVVRFVAIPADRARPDFLLGGEVERFEHLPTDQPPRVAIAFNLALVTAAGRSSMTTRHYRGEEPVTGEGPDAVAEAFDRLAARLIAEAVRDAKGLKSSLAAVPQPSDLEPAKR
jgi:cholesterol transport system auxiliary component